MRKQCYRYIITVSRRFVISRYYREPVGRYGTRAGRDGKRSRKWGNIEKIVETKGGRERGEGERGGERGGRGGREREKYLSLPEIPGMNGSINSPGGRENYWMECSEYMP